MILLYRDRDRLFVSVFLSLLLFILLYLFLELFLKLPLTPFPETTTLLLLDLQPEGIRGEEEKKETTPISPPPPKELILPTPGPETSPQQPTPPVIQPAVPKVSTPPTVAPVPKGEGTKEPQPQVSPYPLRKELPEPTPRRIQPFTPSEVKDPLAAEREFLQSEKAKLETWLRENAPTPPPSPQASPPKAEPVPSPVQDPTIQKVTEQLAAINRRLEQLKTAPGIPPQTSEEGRETVSREPLKPIYDREGREIGKGELKGRVPLFPLNIGSILPEDFEGFPIQNLELRAEFLIGETGLLEPGSLKIFGDSRYTRIVEKVRSALEKWRFDSRPGIRTQAVIHFLIKVKGM
jgi:hypothetical protein